LPLDKEGHIHNKAMKQKEYQRLSRVPPVTIQKSERGFVLSTERFTASGLNIAINRPMKREGKKTSIDLLFELLADGISGSATLSDRRLAPLRRGKKYMVRALNALVCDMCGFLSACLQDMTDQDYDSLDQELLFKRIDIKWILKSVGYNPDKFVSKKEIVEEIYGGCANDITTEEAEGALFKLLRLSQITYAINGIDKDHYDQGCRRPKKITNREIKEYIKKGIALAPSRIGGANFFGWAKEILPPPAYEKPSKVWDLQKNGFTPLWSSVMTGENTFNSTGEDAVPSCIMAVDDSKAVRNQSEINWHFDEIDFHRFPVADISRDRFTPLKLSDVSADNDPRIDDIRDRMIDGDHEMKFLGVIDLPDNFIEIARIIGNNTSTYNDFDDSKEIGSYWVTAVSELHSRLYAIFGAKGVIIASKFIAGYFTIPSTARAGINESDAERFISQGISPEEAADEMYKDIVGIDDPSPIIAEAAFSMDAVASASINGSQRHEFLELIKLDFPHLSLDRIASLSDIVIEKINIIYNEAAVHNWMDTVGADLTVTPYSFSEKPRGRKKLFTNLLDDFIEGIDINFKDDIESCRFSENSDAI
jgi:hypothetical protein